PFFVENGESFQLREQVDAVFSNAALHWMTSPSKVITCVRNALKDGGRFVAEFGGKGNVERVVQSLIDILYDEYGIDAGTLNPWYFPSIGQYSTLLEQQGFRVVYASHFDRPTEMTDGEDGLRHWLTGFAGNFFSTLTDTEKENVLFKMAAQLRDEL